MQLKIAETADFKGSCVPSVASDQRSSVGIARKACALKGEDELFYRVRVMGWPTGRIQVLRHGPDSGESVGYGNRIGRLTRKIKRVKFGFYTDLCYLCNKIADDDDCKAISHRHTNVLTDYS